MAANLDLKKLNHLVILNSLGVLLQVVQHKALQQFERVLLKFQAVRSRIGDFEKLSTAYFQERFGFSC